MNEKINTLLSKFGIKTKPKTNLNESSIHRYRNIPIHAIFLYTSEDSIVSDYLINNWGALDTLSGDFCDIHQTIDQFESKEDAYDFIDNLRVIQDSKESIIEKLPGIFFWNTKAKSKFISFKDIETKEELTRFIRQIFSHIRKNTSIEALNKFKKGKKQTFNEQVNKPKFKWWMLALLAGVLSILLYKILEANPDWLVEAAIGIVVSIIVLMLNPIRRYYKAFWTCITLLGTLTLIPAFGLKSKIEKTNLEGTEKKFFEFIVQDQHPILYFIIGLIAITALILDYYERRNKSS